MRSSAQHNLLISSLALRDGSCANRTRSFPRAIQRASANKRTVRPNTPAANLNHLRANRCDTCVPRLAKDRPVATLPSARHRLRTNRIAPSTNVLERFPEIANEWASPVGAPATNPHLLTAHNHNVRAGRNSHHSARVTRGPAKERSPVGDFATRHRRVLADKVASEILAHEAVLADGRRRVSAVLAEGEKLLAQVVGAFLSVGAKPVRAELLWSQAVAEAVPADTSRAGCVSGAPPSTTRELRQPMGRLVAAGKEADQEDGDHAGCHGGVAGYTVELPRRGRLRLYSAVEARSTAISFSGRTLARFLEVDTLQTVSNPTIRKSL